MSSKAPTTAAPVAEALVRDEEIDARRRREGVAALPLFSAEDLEQLRRAHAALHPEPGRGFEMDFSFMAPDHKAQVDRAIRAVLGPAVDRALHPVRLYNLSFVTKWPDGGGELPIHQDWSYVDEDAHECCTLWVPLDEVSPELDNGPLALLPRSHLLPSPPRGANSRPWYLPYRDELAAHLVTPRLEPGEGLIFSCRMLHGSTPNRSDAPRRAITAMVAVEDAPLRYFHVDGERWNAYEVDEGFFVENGPIDLRLGNPRGAELVGTRPAAPPKAPLEDLATICGVELAEAEGDAAPSWAIAGTPLGGPQPPEDGPGAARLGVGLHRVAARWSRRAEGPQHRCLGEAATELARAWEQRDPTVPEAWGLLPAGPIDGEVEVRPVPDADRARDPLAVAVRSAVGDAPAWLVDLGPASVLPARRSGNNLDRICLLPLALHQSPGTVLFQAGDRIEALEAARPLSFDPTVEHGIWNFGAGRVPLLVVAGPAPAPPGLRHLAAWLERTGRLRRYDPVPA